MRDRAWPLVQPRFQGAPIISRDVAGDTDAAIPFVIFAEFGLVGRLAFLGALTLDRAFRLNLLRFVDDDCCLSH